MHTSLLSVALILVFGIATAWGEPAVTNSLAGLSERLGILTANKAHSYQRLIRDASHVVRGVALDRPWSEVEPELRRQGLQQIHAHESQHMRHYRYLVTKNGWQGGDKTAHSLYLEFQVDSRNSDTAANAKPGSVMTAEAGLIVEPNRQYAQVLIGGAYADGSVLFRGLRLPEVKLAARSYPVIKKIEVTYDFIRDRWSESLSQGFSLRLTFGDSDRDDRRGKSMSFTIPSGLDALQDWHGKPLQQQFEPQDTIGEFRSWGSSEWGPSR